MTIDAVVGQRDTWQRLVRLSDEGCVPHALLLCGPSGCGKMAIALAFASRLLNDSNLVASLTHPDLHFTFPTVKLASMGSEHQPTSDDFGRQWREMLGESPYFTLEHWMRRMGATNQQAVITGAESDELSRKLNLKASQGGKKVSIIWLPERMNQTSANKLLKILEEPPGDAVFLLVSEAPEQLLATIRSRTQCIEMPRIEASELEAALVARCGIDAATARRIARAADGSWTKAVNMLRPDSEEKEFLDMFITLTRQAYKRRVTALKQWSDTAGGLGREKQKRLLTYIGRMVRESFMYNFRAPELCYMTQEEENFAGNFSPFVNEDNVVALAEAVEEAHRQIAQNAVGRIVFFALALQVATLLSKRK